jgi:hypothetical protein
MVSDEQIEIGKVNADFRAILKLAHKNPKRAREMTQGCRAAGEISSAMAEYLLSLSA